MAKAATIVETSKNSRGFPIRLQRRGNVWDVTYCTGFCWKYVTGGKRISEQAARNVFFMETL